MKHYSSFEINMIPNAINSEKEKCCTKVKK